MSLKRVYVLQTKLHLPKYLSKLIFMYLSVCYMCFSPSVNLNQAEVWPIFGSLVENTKCELCQFGLDFSFLCGNSQPVPNITLFTKDVEIAWCGNWSLKKVRELKHSTKIKYSVPGSLPLAMVLLLRQHWEISLNSKTHQEGEKLLAKVKSDCCAKVDYERSKYSHGHKLLLWNNKWWFWISNLKGRLGPVSVTFFGPKEVGWAPCQ